MVDSKALEDILNEISSDSDSEQSESQQSDKSSSQHSSASTEQPLTIPPVVVNAQTSAADIDSIDTVLVRNPYASFSVASQSESMTEVQQPVQSSHVQFQQKELSLADRLLAQVDKIQDKIIEQVKETLKSSSSDESPERPSRQKLRAYQAQAFRSFTVGATVQQKQAMYSKNEQPINEDEKSRILRQIVQESSQENSDEQDSSHSMMSEEDLLNHSLESDAEPIIDEQNFLRFVSEQPNVLDTVDKNERSFKQVAEKMIEQSSQLSAIQSEPVRLMGQKLFEQIADRFHGDVGIAQGIPYSIAAIEDLIAIGCSDGSIRLFDDTEQELKVLTDKTVQGNAVTCLDIKRIAATGHIYVVSGHMKGNVTMYEIKGLLSQQQLQTQQQKGLMVSLFGNVSFKHLKTIDDLHQQTVIQIKFAGDLQREIQVMSCDISGVAQICTFTPGLLTTNVVKQLLMKSRLGAVYSLAPLVEYCPKPRSLNPYQVQKGIAEEKYQLIAFGSLDEVYVCQFRPCSSSLLSLRRPPYVQAGSVPYLDWGLALTPSFRDKAYPILAIAWGRTVQLVVYTNRNEVSSNEPVNLQLDGFYICDAFSIDSVFFLSESLLFLIVNKKEVRILYTQNFTPGAFDESYFMKNLTSRKIGADMNAEEEQPAIRNFSKLKEKYAGQVSAYAEKDSGFRMVDEEIRHKDNQHMSQQRSKFNFNQTVCKNYGYNVIALGKTQIAQRNLIHWQDYLQQIQMTQDWLTLLRAALEIFSGKLIGLAGLPDQKEERELLLRLHMKEILRANVKACITEFQEGFCLSQKTLRVCTEFCIRVGALDFLFGELFQMFAEGGVEQRFFENLDAFILSGKLKKANIPFALIERILSLYRSKDLELLEKAILNLNLAKYRQATEVRVLCEEEFLSSALIHLLTEEEDNSCLQVLCALFNLTLRANKTKTKADVQSLMKYLQLYGTSIFEVSNTDAAKTISASQQEIYKKSRSLKQEIERSAAYISYKILWVMRLFIEGQKFPTGQLSPHLHRLYVMDIVRFCTNDQFLIWFLKFDPDAFLSVLIKLFTDPLPNQYIQNQQKFIETHPEVETVPTHTQILSVLHNTVHQLLDQQKNTAAGEQLHNAFLFFMTWVATISSIEVRKETCLRLTEQQIRFHKQLWMLPKKALNDLVPSTLHARQTKDRICNIYTYLIKNNEKNIIKMLVQHQHVLQPTEIDSLVDLIQSAPLFKLKIFLRQLQGEFQKCLTQFFQVKAIKSDIFQWLNQIQSTLQNKENDDFFAVKGVLSRISLTEMKQLLLVNISDFVQMSPEKAVSLCDQWFDSDYLQVVTALNDEEIAYSFLTTVLQIHEPMIERQMQDSKPKAKQLLLKLVEIAAEREEVTELVARSYFPIDECLAICEQKDSLEATAVLYRRKGLYLKSIKCYVQTLVRLCVDKLVHTLFVEKNIKFEDKLSTDENMFKFDSLLNQIVKICQKYGQRQSQTEMEELWMYAIRGLFQVASEVHRQQKLNQSSSSSSESSQGQEEQAHFEQFLLIRNQYFMSRMSEHVNLIKIIRFLEERGHSLKYDDFKKVFQEKIEMETYFVQILETAKALGNKEVVTHQDELITVFNQGVGVQKALCASCSQGLLNRFDRQDIWLMPCNHSFHARCVVQSEGTCSVCFNEIGALQTFLKLKKEKAAKVSNADFTASSRSTSLSESEDILSIIKKRREVSLKLSIDSANKPKIVRRRLESKQDKFQRLMSDFDKEQMGLNIRNFKL